jgi:hypothetical protein
LLTLQIDTRQIGRGKNGSRRLRLLEACPQLAYLTLQSHGVDTRANRDDDGCREWKPGQCGLRFSVVDTRIRPSPRRRARENCARAAPHAA